MHLICVCIALVTYSTYILPAAKTADPVNILAKMNQELYGHPRNIGLVALHRQMQEEQARLRADHQALHRAHDQLATQHTQVAQQVTQHTATLQAHGTTLHTVQQQQQQFAAALAPAALAKTCAANTEFINQVASNSAFVEALTRCVATQLTSTAPFVSGVAERVMQHPTVAQPVAAVAQHHQEVTHAVAQFQQEHAAAHQHTEAARTSATQMQQQTQHDLQAVETCHAQVTQLLTDVQQWHTTITQELPARFQHQRDRINADMAQLEQQRNSEITTASSDFLDKLEKSCKKRVEALAQVKLQALDELAAKAENELKEFYNTVLQRVNTLCAQAQKKLALATPAQEQRCEGLLAQATKAIMQQLLDHGSAEQSTALSPTASERTADDPTSPLLPDGTGAGGGAAGAANATTSSGSGILDTILSPLSAQSPTQPTDASHGTTATAPTAPTTTAAYAAAQTAQPTSQPATSPTRTARGFSDAQDHEGAARALVVAQAEAAAAAQDQAPTNLSEVD